MDKALKGLMLSGLLLPGLGQLALGRTRRGLVFIGLVLAAVVVIVVKAVSEALAVLEALSADTGMLDISEISRVAHESVTVSDSRLMAAMLGVIVVCWVVSSVDAYVVGSTEARAEEPST